MPPKIKPKAIPRRTAASTEGSNTPTSTTTGGQTAPTATTNTINEANQEPSPATTRSIAPPAGRLDSLRVPSVTPTTGAGKPRVAVTASGSASGSLVAGGSLARGGKAPLRFKPKAVARRTAEERAALEAKVTPTAPAPTPSTSTGTDNSRGRRGFSSRGPRGGGRGRGGRGGFSSTRGGFDSGPSTASGPFALGSVTSGRRKVILERGTSEGRAAFQSLGKMGKGGGKIGSRGLGRESTEGGTKPDPDEGLEIYSSSEEESDGVPKISVEDLEVLKYEDEDEDDFEDDGDVEMVGARKVGGGRGGRMPVMFPVRVERSRHEEKAAPVPIFKDPDGAPGKRGERRRGRGVVKTEDGMEVKPEPIDGDMILPDAPPLTSVPPSPEVTKKTPMIKQSASRSPDALRKPMPTTTPGTDTKKAPRKSSSAGKRGRRPSVISPEEELEIKREEEDRLATLRELGVALPSIEPSVPTEGSSEEAEAAEVGADVSAIKAGDLFFFQFPNVLPPLVPITDPNLETADSDPTVNVKSEPGTNPAPSATSSMPPPPAPAPAPTPTSTAPTPTPKRRSTRTSHQNNTRQLPLPAGIAGQLRIHKSGRVSILWGNPDPGNPSAQPIEMEVTRGAECEFLQDVVVLKPDVGEDAVGGVGEAGEKKGMVWAMGQVRGRFVVSPEFGKLMATVRGR